MDPEVIARLEAQIASVRKENEAAISALRNETETAVSALRNETETAISALQRKVTAIQLHLIAGQHLFWATAGGRWLTVPEVQERELELDCHPNERIETISQCVREIVANEDAGMTAVRTTARKEWDKARDQTISRLSPTISALPVDEERYPEGRGDKKEVVVYLKTHFVGVAQRRNDKVHRYTAGTIAAVLSAFNEDIMNERDKHPNFPILCALFNIIFGCTYDHISGDDLETEIENYGGEMLVSLDSGEDPASVG
ncbi:hypothetical protein B0H19DRAFT_572756 [Mycena capillaripes]|nr:hypothetical protein B0H19DRAFT_572756 [Mycena capillaripes]